MSRRHELAQALPGAHLERAWHHSSHNWCWEANVIDIRSDDKDRMTLQWSSKQETVPLPSMNVCKGKQAEDGGYNDRVTRRLIDRFASSRQSWQSDCGVLDQLAPIEAIAKDMSAVVGWASPHQLVHIRMNDLKVTEIWNIWDSKYPDISHTLHELQDFRTLFVKIAMSSCGRAVCYVLWDYVVVIDVMTGNLVQNQACGATDLARAFGNSAPTWSRTLNDLAQAGLVIKHGQKYHLTELGAARVRAQS